MTDSGPLREDGAEAGGMGCSEMVGSGGDRPSGCKGVGSGGGGWGGGYRGRRDGAAGNDRQALKAGDTT